MEMTQMSMLMERAREFTLASALASYADTNLQEALAGLETTLGAHEGAGPLLAALRRQGGIEDVASAYIELFDRGGERASLYESEYGRMRGMGKGNTLADIGGFYQAFGLTLDQEGIHELPDHIAVELEFYGLLLLKQEHLKDDEEGRFVVEDARRKFLTAHLGRFSRAIAEREDVRADPVYGPVFTWCWQLVARECSDLGVDPAPLDFFADKDEKEEMKCGAVHLPVIS